jgi:hypothetical protein
MVGDGLSPTRLEAGRRPHYHDLPIQCWGPTRDYWRRRLDQTWRVVFAISATALVAVGAFFAIRFINGLLL